MAYFPCFLSVVFVVRNQGDKIEKILSEAAEVIAKTVSDYELIVVDNASDDDSVMVLKGLTSEKGLANLQVYALGSSDQLAATVRQVENPAEFGAIDREISRTHRLGELVSSFLRVTRVISPYPSAFFEPSTNWTRQTAWSIERCFSLGRESALSHNRTDV